MRATTNAFVLLSACVLLPACAADPQGGGDPPGGDDGSGSGSGSGSGETDPCATPVAVPLAGRPLDLMPPSRLAEVAARMPCLAPGSLREVVESPRTFWYDKASLTPGYQDSFGDNVVTPIGMRPNTIDPGLINLAVPGGHQQIFVELGTFHFPFGKPIGDTTNVEVVDFWQLPEAGGAVLPVVHWRRDPNDYTHRVEWMFPAGTVFGELLLMTEDGVRYPFEIRTRTRTVDGWTNDVYRPFPRAADLADAIEARRATDPAATSPALDALVTQLRSGGLAPYRVAATHFPGAFPTRTGRGSRWPRSWVSGCWRSTAPATARAARGWTAPAWASGWSSCSASSGWPRWRCSAGPPVAWQRSPPCPTSARGAGGWSSSARSPRSRRTRTLWCWPRSVPPGGPSWSRRSRWRRRRPRPRSPRTSCPSR